MLRFKQVTTTKTGVRFTHFRGVRVSQYSGDGLRALPFAALYDRRAPSVERTHLGIVFIIQLTEFNIGTDVSADMQGAHRAGGRVTVIIHLYAFLNKVILNSLCVKFSLRVDITSSYFS